MTLRAILLNGGVALTLFLCPVAAEAQTTYPLGGGSVTYTGAAPVALGLSGYDASTTAAPVNVVGVTIVQTSSDHPALLVDQDNDGPLTVTFTGAPSSITGGDSALSICHCGFTETGDVSLNTTGTTGGNVFTAGGYGTGVDFENDIGPFSTGTVVLGADTISSVNGYGLEAFSGSGSLSVTSAANITSTGGIGINAVADNVLSVTVSGSVSGGQGSVALNSVGQSSLTLQTGATLTGDATGSQNGAGSALILQGHGTTGNNFVNFNTMEVQDSSGGTWHLQGTSNFSGALHVDAGGSVTIDTGGELSAQTVNQDAGGSIILNGGTLDPTAINIQGGTFGGTGTVIGNLNVTGGTVQVGASPDSLVVHGNYSQTGGIITFEIDPNGAGGFLESSLILDAGSTVSINGTEIMFDFAGGADPLAFLNSGTFNLDTFFKSSSGNPFSTDFNFGTVFGGDSFGITAPGFAITNFAFDPDKGAIALDETSVGGVPEPATWAMMLAGFSGIGFMVRGSRRKAAVATA